MVTRREKKMKKLLGIVVLGLLWCTTSFAGSGNLKQLNLKLVEVEKQLDSCISSKDKDICEKIILENPLLLKIYGNVEFAKLINSNKCQVGAATKCGAAMSRISAKYIQIISLISELY